MCTLWYVLEENLYLEKWYGYVHVTWFVIIILSAKNYTEER